MSSFSRGVKLVLFFSPARAGAILLLFTSYYPQLTTYFSLLTKKIKPAMEIAGLCLPLKPQKERGYIGLSIID